jgi:predicted HTH domain antitoxin
MATLEVDIPEELLTLLQRSRLGNRPVDEQLRIALAAYLFQEGVISMGKAASISGETRAGFELLLAEMGIPAVRYGLEEYRRDRESLENIDRTSE